MGVAEHEGAGELIGRRLGEGKYELLECLGEGAMGAVYKALHTDLSRTVAIKVMHPHVMRRPKAEARFRREAQAASRLTHPNSLQILDFGTERDGFCYIVMEFLDGRSLHDALGVDGFLPTARSVEIMSQVLGALAAAHDQGIVHRDMKPENVMLVSRVGDDGAVTETVKVCDFGIAKIQTPDSDEREPTTGPTLTAEGEVCGTPDYMSPEQAQGRDLDARSDLYSCGVVLYTMLTGRPPFDANSAIGVLVAHVSEAPKPPTLLNPDIPPEVERVILWSLAKSPSDRPSNARELRAALLAAVPEAAGSTASSGLRPAPAKIPTGSTALPRGAETHDGLTAAPATRSRRPLAIAIGLGLALGGAGVAAFLAFGPDARAPSPPTTLEARAQVAPTPKPEPVAATLGLPEKAPEPILEPTPQADVAIAEAADASPAEAADVAAAQGPDIALALLEADVEGAEVAVAEAPEVPEMPTPSEDDDPPKVAKTAPPVVARKDAADRAGKATVQLLTGRGELDPKQLAPDPPAPAAEPPKTTPPVVETPEAPPATEPQPDTRPKKPVEAPPANPPAPEPTFEATVGLTNIAVHGPLSAGVVLDVVQRQMADFRACYTRAARDAGRDAASSVEVSLTIDEDGRARGVSASGGRLPGLDACVRSVASRLRSSRRPDTGTAEASFVLRFTPTAP